MPLFTLLVGYTDDNTAVTVAQNTDNAQRRLKQVMRRLCSWLKEIGLDLATEETEIVLFTRRPIPQSYCYKLKLKLYFQRMRLNT